MMIKSVWSSRAKSEPGEDRTLDTILKRDVLYQLSYRLLNFRFEAVLFLWWFWTDRSAGCICR